MDESLSAAAQAVKEFESLNNEIAYYVDANAETFSVFTEMVEARNQALEKATRLMREEVTAARTTRIYGDFRVEQSVKGYHADLPGLIGAHRDILEAHPELVLGLHIPAVRTLHPFIYSEHPEVISQIDGKRLYQLATDERIPKDVLDRFIQVETTTKAFVPKAMELSVGTSKRPRR